MTPEEAAAYRAQVRAKLEEEKKAADDKRLKEKIEAEELARINRKPLPTQLLDLGKSALRKALEEKDEKKG